MTSSVPRTNNTTLYINEAYKFGYLNREEERELLEDYKLNGNVEAKHTLVKHHLGDVINMAREFSGYNVQYLDLVQEGNIGLMKAIDKFSLDYDVRLKTFSTHHIKSEIYNFIIKNHKIVNVATSKPYRKLFFSLRKNKKHLGVFTNQEVNDLATKLNVKPKQVRDMEERLQPNSFVSFETPLPSRSIASSDDDFDSTPSGFVSSDCENPEENLLTEEVTHHNRVAMYESLKTLDPRSKDIVRRRYLDAETPTLHELAKEYKVSAERIRQIEQTALKKMHTWMVN